jgi:hypothetical protein
VGPTLLRHVNLGYSETTLAIRPSEALLGKTTIELFFGQATCPHCAPTLKDFRELTAQRSDTAVILVLVRMERADSKR